MSNPERGLLLPGKFGEDAHYVSFKRTAVLSLNDFFSNYSYVPQQLWRSWTSGKLGKSHCAF